LVITNNIPALQAATNLSRTNKALAKSMNNLSIGTKINSAKDDAAGLAIANKLKVQTQGLYTASQNSMDGISLIQTAEGALGEMQNMLQRMRELCVQAANDTNTPDDREKMQIEFNELSAELTGMSQRTEFNKIRILSGELYKDDKNISDLKLASIRTTLNGMFGTPFGTNTEKMLIDNLNDFTNDLTLQIGPNQGMEFDFSIPKITARTLGLEVYVEEPTGWDSSVDGEWNPWKGVWSNELETYSVSSDIYSWQHAEGLLAVTDDAINRISAIRARMGAAQNRLEHTVTSLDNTALNTDRARSRIEDTDMAWETTTYSSKNVIAQGAISIIAQANMRPQSILQLL